jgi:23S rRNA pseudouridine1911/1915/1917 synthase
VHMAEAGHPVLGDPRYGRTAAQHESWRENRLALHALSLGLEHPVTGKRLLFTSELPDCMRRFIGM